MLAFKFIIFVSSLAGSYCMSVECFALINIECGEYDISKIQRPETTEDLKHFCSTLIPQMHCAGKVMEKCAQDKNMREDEKDQEIFREMLSFIDSSCEEESQVFQAIANNLNCIMSTIDSMDHICLIGGLNDTQREKLSSIVEGHFSCVIDSWKYYCMNAKFDVECGNDVRNAVASILDNVDILAPYCKHMRSELLYFEAAFKSEFSRRNYGQAALPGIFEALSKQAD